MDDKATAPLTVEALDSLNALIAADQSDVIGAYFAVHLTAYLEWYWLVAAGHPIGRLADHGPFAEFDRQLRSKATSWFGSSHGFIRVRRSHTDTDDLRWVQFRVEFERKALAAGFDGTWAKQLTGAMGELEDNIHWHSEAPETGMVAYSAQAGRLELVVMDRGIGVLASLRRADQFGHLEDHGSALQLAIRDGASRYGAYSGRGWGFNPLFVGLANRDTRLRFRSGDHVLRIASEPPGGPEARLRQLAAGQGFLVAVTAFA